MGAHPQHTLPSIRLCRADAVVAAPVLGGHDTATATARLHPHVHRLRLLRPNPERLTFRASGHQLTVHPGELDTERFEALLEEGATVRPHDADRAAELIRKALELWEGLPFEDTDALQMLDTAHRLDQRHHLVPQELNTAERARGSHTAVPTELAQHPHRPGPQEHLRALLMAAHRCGRPGHALWARHRARRHLRQEPNRPGPELPRIQHHVLAGRPTTPAAGAGPSHERAALHPLAITRPQAAVPPLTTAGVGRTTLAVHGPTKCTGPLPNSQLFLDPHGHGPHPVGRIFAATPGHGPGSVHSHPPRATLRTGHQDQEVERT